MVEFLSVSSHGRGRGTGGGGGVGSSRAIGSSFPPQASTPGISKNNGGGTVTIRRGASLTRGFRGSSAGAVSSPSSSSSPSPAASRRSLSRPRARQDPWHEEIKAGEAVRRAKVGNLLEMIGLNITAHKDLLGDSSLETSRAHRLVLGIAQVHELMGTSGAAAASSIPPQSSTTGAADEHPAQQEGKQSTTSSSSSSSSTSTFLVSLQQSEEIVAENFISSSDQLHAVDLKLMKTLAEIQETRGELETRATRVLTLLRTSEEQTVAAWDAYLEAIQASRGDKKSAGGSVFSEFFSGGGGSAHGSSLSRSRSGSPEGGAGSPSGEGTGDADAARSSGQDDANAAALAAAIASSSTPTKVDPWLAELTYRRTLLSQKKTMDSSLKELEEVFGQVTNYECRRRINLREYMILVCTSTKWVFTGAEAAQAAAVRDWIEKDFSADTIQKQVSESVRDRLEALMFLDSDTSAADNPAEEEAEGKGVAEEEEGRVGGVENSEVGEPPEGTGSDPVSVAMFYAGLFPATSPLQSEFLACAVVVERVYSTTSSSRNHRNGGGGGGGGGGDNSSSNDNSRNSKYLALAVVTIDQMLHLFDLKEDSGVSLDDPPERALDAFLKETAGRGSGSGSLRDQYSIEPTRTVDLSLMRTTLGSNSDDNVVELLPDPDVKTSSSSSCVPMSLRTFSAREQAQLINAIHGDSIQAIF